MRRCVLKFFVVMVAAFAIGGCTFPIGSIGDFEYDAFWVVPRRMTYTLYDAFEPQDDVSAFASYQGAVDSIPIAKVNVWINMTPDNSPDKWILVSSDGFHYFLGETSGKKGVRVDYGTHSDEYSIQVLSSSNGNENGDPGNGNGDDGFFELDWSGVKRNP